MAEGRDTPDLPRGLIDRRGTPIGKSTRLPSIRGPRDLTLGGIPKKIFTPNIPVRKPAEQKEPTVKDENQSTSNETKPKPVKDAKPKPKINKDKSNEKGRDRGKNIVQSHSIFEQGPSKDVHKNTVKDTESLGGRFHSKTSETTSTPRIIKKEMADSSKEILDFLLRDDFVDDQHKRDKFMEPVHLPLTKLNMKLEQDPVLVKDDPDEDVEMTDVQNKQVKPTPMSDNVLEALTKSESGELLFFQFPDCMPGTPVSRKDPEKETKDEETPQQSQMLSDFSEGFVGKLVVRKSGRAQLVMGNITMDVSMGTKCGFLQDVVSIHTDEHGGDLSVLGHIKHRLVCIPDFDSMLDT